MDRAAEVACENSALKGYPLGDPALLVLSTEKPVRSVLGLEKIWCSGVTVEWQQSSEWAELRC